MPGYEVNFWQGLFAPAGTPEPVIARLEAALLKAQQSPEFAARLREANVQLNPGGAERLRALLAELRPFAQDAKPTVAALSNIVSRTGAGNDLIELSHAIHAEPELAFEEFRSCAKTQTLVAERGFEGTSVGEIAAKAQVSKPVVYEHFGGKEGLYAVVVDRERGQPLPVRLGHDQRAVVGRDRHAVGKVEVVGHHPYRPVGGDQRHPSRCGRAFRRAGAELGVGTVHVGVAATVHHDVVGTEV